MPEGPLREVLPVWSHGQQVLIGTRFVWQCRNWDRSAVSLAVWLVLDDNVTVSIPEHGRARDADEAVRVEERVEGADALIGDVPAAAGASVAPTDVAVLAEDDAVVLGEARLPPLQFGDASAALEAVRVPLRLRLRHVQEGGVCDVQLAAGA